MARWKEGYVRMMVGAGSQLPRQISVRGWVGGLFGVDERSNYTPQRSGKVWCITHIPTGFAARFVIGPRKLAQQIADEIEAAADWNFSDPAEAKSRGEAVMTVMARHPRCFVTADECGQPRADFRYPEEVSA